MQMEKNGNKIEKKGEEERTIRAKTNKFGKREQTVRKRKMLNKTRKCTGLNETRKGAGRCWRKRKKMLDETKNAVRDEKRCGMKRNKVRDEKEQCAGRDGTKCGTRRDGTGQDAGRDKTWDNTRQDAGRDKTREYVGEKRENTRETVRKCKKEVKVRKRGIVRKE